LYGLPVASCAAACRVSSIRSADPGARVRAELSSRPARSPGMPFGGMGRRRLRAATRFTLGPDRKTLPLLFCNRGVAALGLAGLCFIASVHGADIQASHSCGSVKMTGMALP
jgi:hypothetical protein